MTDIGISWPEGFATLCSTAVPWDMLEQVAAEAHCLADRPNYWMPIDPPLQAPFTAAEAVISSLHASTVSAALSQHCSGAEWWVQVYKPGKGLAFHFDKDECAMKERHEMIQPILSSVLYLTGDANADRSGPTVILDQQYDRQLGRAVPDSPSRTALVYPFKNNYVLFDGRLGHGVLESSSPQPRMTLLINWWADKPQDIDRITKEVINQHSLSSYTPSKPMPHKDKATAAGSAVETPLAIRLQAASISAADTTAQSPCRPGSAAVTSDETASQDSHGRPSYSSQSMPHLQSPSQQVTAPDSQQPSSRNSISNEAEADTPHAAADSLHSASLHASSHDTTHAQSPSNMSDRPQAATPAAAATSQAHSSEHVAKGAAGREPGSAVEPKPLTVPSVSIQGWDDSPVTVDDVLDTYRLTLTGPKAIHAVAIDHTGFELFPLDEENMEANGGSIMTAAALVPCGTFSSSDDSSASEPE